MISSQINFEQWEMIEPFEISREIITSQAVLKLTLIDSEGHRGMAEAAGVDYDGETPHSMADQIQAIAPHLHDAVTGEDLLHWLPPGGARNAVDCALWDLRAKQRDIAAWQTAGLRELCPVVTTFTIGLGDEATTRRKVRAAQSYPILKLKVDATRHLDIIQIVREEHPSARIVLDANQAWSMPLLRELMPELVGTGVELLEQPLAIGCDDELLGFQSPIPIAADESCTDRHSIAGLQDRYQYINIKLDKCGGLTEALAMITVAQQATLGLMVGNMCGSSLAMAPAFLLAQRCHYVDLDGPLLQRKDSPHGLRYSEGVIQVPDRALWG